MEKYIITVDNVTINLNNIEVATYNCDPFAAFDYIDDVAATLRDANWVDVLNPGDDDHATWAARLDLPADTDKVIYVIDNNRMALA